MEGRSLAGTPDIWLCQHDMPDLAQPASACRFMAFDRHMNLVLGDSEEFRKLPPKKGKSDDEVSPAILCQPPPSAC